MQKNHGLLRECWDFLRVRKAWWITPILIVLFLIALLLIFAQSAPVSQVMYVLIWHHENLKDAWNSETVAED